MLSNLCELGGMGAISTGIWFAAGRSAGLIAAGVFALVAGLALDGVKLPKRRRKQ